MSNKPNKKEPGIEPTKKSYDELPERTQKFIDFVAEGYHKTSKDRAKAGARMRLEDAYVGAGYSEKGAKQAGWALYMRVKHIIYKRRAEMVDMNMDVNMASEVIRELCHDKDQPGSIRLKAAERILTNQGFDRPQEIILTKKVEELSKEEIEAELEDLLSGVKEPNTDPTTACH